MEEENFDFSIEKALKKVYSGGDTRMDTQALVAIDQIENLIKTSQNGKELPVHSKLLAYYGLVFRLINENQQSEEKWICYVGILKHLLNTVFSLPQEYEALRGKTISSLQKMAPLESLVNSLIVKKATPELVTILKYIIYSKNSDNFQTNLSPESMENLLASIMSGDQEIRRSAIQAFIFMFENDFGKNNKLMKQMTDFLILNLEAWFMKKDESLYILYFLNTAIQYLGLKDIKKIIAPIIEILKAPKSNPNLRKIGCLVIQGLCDKKHVQTGFAEQMLDELLEIAENQFYKAKNDQEVISLVQVISSVYLNYNRGTPYKSKEKLVPILNVYAELLSIDSDQQTNLDVQALNSIKSSVTKNFELLLIESCDEYLLNPSEEIDIFNTLQVTSVKEHDSSSKGPLNARQRIFVCLNNLCTSRFKKSASFVLSIISGFVDRIRQMEYGYLSDISMELIKLLHNIKSSFDFESEAQICMGKIVSTVDMELLLVELPVRVIELDMTDPNYDEQSNAFILSLLCTHLKNGYFPVYYKHFWPQLSELHDKIEMQEAFDAGEEKEKFLLKNLKTIRDQYFTVLKNCNKFHVDYIHELEHYVSDIIDSFLSAPDKKTSERLGEPLRQLLIFAYNNRTSHPSEYQNVVKIAQEKKLLQELCKANSKVEKSATFIADCIKILILMLEPKNIERIFTSNLERLSKEFTLKLEELLKNPQKLKKNLRDLDTVLLFVDSFKDIEKGNLYAGILTFLQQLLDTKNQQVWKRAITLSENLVKGISYVENPKILEMVHSFYLSNMKADQNKSKQQSRKSSRIIPEAEMDEEEDGENSRQEGMHGENDKQRKLKDLLVRFLAAYVHKNYIERFKDLEEIPNQEDAINELREFSYKYLSLAILSIKSRSAKTRDNAKKLLIYIDEAYSTIVKNDTVFMNLILAGLAGETSLMKSSTILSLALIFAKKFNQLDQDYIDRLIEIVLIIIKEKNAENYKAVVAFFKFYVKRAKQITLKKQLSVIIGAVLTWDETSHESIKNIVRTLLETIYKKVGKEAILQATPEKHHSLIRYIGKQITRQVNLKKKLVSLKGKIEVGAEKEKKDKKLVDLDFIEKHLLSMQENIKGANAGNMEEEKKDEYKNMLLQFDALKERFHFTKHNIFQIKSAHEEIVAKKQAEKQEMNDVYFDEVSGKLIIKDTKAKDQQIRGKRSKGDALDRELDDEEENDPNEESRLRKKLNVHDPSQKTYAAKVLERALKRNQNNTVHNIREDGSKYMARKGTSGDVRIPGKAEPHAFIQLNPLALQKKYRERASQVFDYLMQKKKTGVFKGLKQKINK